jgi:hypothetical protein
MLSATTQGSTPAYLLVAGYRMSFEGSQVFKVSFRLA